MRAYLEVYGCTANKSDLCLVKGELTKNRHEIVTEIKNADVIVILTCTVIDTTEQRMLSRLRFFKEFNKKIIVSGCMASVQKELVKSILPDSILLPPKFVYHINDVLNSNFDKFRNIEKTEFAKKYDEFAAPVLIAAIPAQPSDHPFIIRKFGIASPSPTLKFIWVRKSV